ncbi:MAG: radical SAM protein [Clostridia bacterium]|nr:radical SAM protein [Clostridia bacterium]
MKGMISGIKRMEIHDGDGLRSTVFFKGCPLRCIWCHNPESISFERQVAFFGHKCIRCGACKGEQSERTAVGCPVSAIEVYGREYDPDDLVEILLQDAPFFKNGGGVTLSGGECLAQPDFAIAVAKRLYEQGIGVYIDTCGFAKRETFERIIPYTDKFLFDIKAIDADVHKRYTGQDNRLILDNLQFLCEKGCRVEIRYPLVMGCNDGECDGIAKRLREWQGIEKVKVLQYHSFSASRYEALRMPNTLPATETTLRDVENAVSVLKSHGLHAVNGMLED